MEFKTEFVRQQFFVRPFGLRGKPTIQDVWQFYLTSLKGGNYILEMSTIYSHNSSNSYAAVTLELTGFPENFIYTHFPKKEVKNVKEYIDLEVTQSQRLPDCGTFVLPENYKCEYFEYSRLGKNLEHTDGYITVNEGLLTRKEGLTAYYLKPVVYLVKGLNNLMESKIFGSSTMRVYKTHPEKELILGDILCSDIILIGNEYTPHTPEKIQKLFEDNRLDVYFAKIGYPEPMIS